MDDGLKQQLLERFGDYLDTAEAMSDEETMDEAAAGTDLFTLFVELAGLRTEVRGESRLVKEALDQFRALFDRLQADRDAVQRQLERQQAEESERLRGSLRPLLLDLLDLRDRLAAGLRQIQQQPPPPRRVLGLFKRRPNEPPSDLAAWREGQEMTLRRLDRLLADRQVSRLELLGRPFDPREARAVSTVSDQRQAHGLVVEEIRPGFRWRDDLLRPADVVVNKCLPDPELQEERLS